MSHTHSNTLYKVLSPISCRAGKGIAFSPSLLTVTFQHHLNRRYKPLPHLVLRRLFNIMTTPPEDVEVPSLTSTLAEHTIAAELMLAAADRIDASVSRMNDMIYSKCEELRAFTGSACAALQEARLSVLRSLSHRRLWLGKQHDAVESSADGIEHMARVCASLAPQEEVSTKSGRRRSPPRVAPPRARMSV